MSYRVVRYFNEMRLNYFDKIDVGFRNRLRKQCENLKFCNFISKVVFESKNNYGELLAFDYGDVTRILVSFKDDVDLKLFEDVKYCLDKVIERVIGQKVFIYVAYENEELSLMVEENYIFSSDVFTAQTFEIDDSFCDESEFDYDAVEVSDYKCKFKDDLVFDVSNCEINQYTVDGKQVYVLVDVNGKTLVEYDDYLSHKTYIDLIKCTLAKYKDKHKKLYLLCDDDYKSRFYKDLGFSLKGGFVRFCDVLKGE